MMFAHNTRAWQNAVIWPYFFDNGIIADYSESTLGVPLVGWEKPIEPDPGYAVGGKSAEIVIS